MCKAPLGRDTYYKNGGAPLALRSNADKKIELGIRVLKMCKAPLGRDIKMEVAPRFELGIEVLQTSALPLGYATMKRKPVTKSKISLKQVYYKNLYHN